MARFSNDDPAIGGEGDLYLRTLSLDGTNLVLQIDHRQEQQYLFLKFTPDLELLSATRASANPNK